MVELRHLTYFRMVAELGSIAKAAAALHMTQPTLSRQMAQLERSVGYELLQRGPRGASLTRAGEGLRTHVGTIMRQVDRIPEVLRVASEGEQVVNLGVPSGVPSSWFTRCRQMLAVEAPHVRLSLHEATSDEQRRLLQTGVIDLGLLHTEPGELHARHVLRQRFGCAVRDAAVLVDREVARLADLAGYTVMAHSAAETPSEEPLLRTMASVNHIDIHWMFRKFSEHCQLIAETSGADVVLLSEASAAKNLPLWRWIPFASSEPLSVVVTWAAWVDETIPGLQQVVDVMRAVEDVVDPRGRLA